MRLTLPYPPSVNHYWRLARGHHVLSADAKAYKAQVAFLCNQSGVRPTDRPVRLTVTAYRPRRRGDLDNTLKALLDALKGYVYQDDAQVVEIHAYRRDDGRDPRVEVAAEELREP